MPLYEYECEACGKRFEIIQKFSDSPAETCKLCAKGPVRRLMSSPAIQFKGSGWYITDYSQKGKSSDASSSTGDGQGSKESTDSKTTPAKPDSGGAGDSTSKPAASSSSKSDAT
jgi:putative FmdB family regulatory protein